jgi:hypothetical protein
LSKCEKSFFESRIHHSCEVGAPQPCASLATERARKISNRVDNKANNHYCHQHILRTTTKTPFISLKGEQNRTEPEATQPDSRLTVATQRGEDTKQTSSKANRLESVTASS